MATRSIWSDLYGVGYGTTDISTAANTSFGIPLLNHPGFSPGTQTINQRKAVGTSYRQTGSCLEYVQGSSIPTTSFEMDVSAKNIGVFLWSLFQSGAFQGASSTYIKYFVPYESATTDVWLTLVRKLAESGDLNSHQIVGAIVKSITFSAEEGQHLKATIEFQGYSFSSAHNVISDTFTFHTASCLLWQNAVITLDGHTINVPKFDLTISNNALTKFYDNATAVRHDAGEFIATGNITIPWATSDEGLNVQLNEFAAGTPSRLVIYWGTGGEISTTDGDLSIIANIRRTDVSIEGEDEIVANVAFECASDKFTSTATTATASTIQVATNGTVTGTNTTFSTSLADGVGFHKGDLLYPFGCSDAGDQTVRVITAISSDTSMTVFPVFKNGESGKLYKVMSTPLTITTCDSTSLSGM